MNNVISFEKTFIGFIPPHSKKKKIDLRTESIEYDRFAIYECLNKIKEVKDIDTLKADIDRLKALADESVFDPSDLDISDGFIDRDRSMNNKFFVYKEFFNSDNELLETRAVLQSV